MGKTIMARYAVYYETVAGGSLTPASWRERRQGQVRGEGKPTAANLAQHVARLNQSFQPGGVNAHCGGLEVVRASIRENRPGGAVVAVYDESGAKLDRLSAVCRGRNDWGTP